MNYTFTIQLDEPHQAAHGEPQAMAGHAVQHKPVIESITSVTLTHRKLAQFLALFRRPSKPKQDLGPI